MDSMESCVPPGFRFHPTDEELVGYYLRKKVASQKIDLDVIRDIDLYRIEPWDLTEHCGIGYEEQSEWYFFSFKDRKYPTGTRTNRATMAGFWKATGRDKAVHERSRLIGMRKTLVFYKGRAPNGQKTDWIMHEYRLETDENAPPQEEGWVVCRAFKKRAAYPSRGMGMAMAERWDSNYSSSPYHDAASGMAAAFADHPASYARSARFKAEDDGAAQLLRYTSSHLVELPQLESPSAMPPALPPATKKKTKNGRKLPEEQEDRDQDEAGGGMVTADWRALDKFVASQLSPGGAQLDQAPPPAGASSQSAQPELEREREDQDDMAALLFLNNDERDEMERWTGLLASASGAGAGGDGDLGICVFDK
ncbi:uncharacterized protein LOC100835498 isoform X1 [Brachypodium distachyon]|nr:NAC domain-containing protein 7-like [Brachypodium distachyon]XP_014755549.1 uncharacterized protein LOC100835498 isoform X1 [Brachypodium distachyon]AFJ91961.1 SWN1 [Brachypodium distachyon]KQK23882.1 hypothetical protein BRADI_1g76732v3 [Brachypodium distachyon]|eukprot:NP_001266879.1 uncharacterized protein LOC100835498 [Brachypodium distachyon]